MDIILKSNFEYSYIFNIISLTFKKDEKAQTIEVTFVSSLGDSSVYQKELRSSDDVLKEFNRIQNIVWSKYYNALILTDYHLIEYSMIS